jgi:hypothetical protein
VIADFEELLRRYIERHPCNATTPEDANDYLFSLESASINTMVRTKYDPPGRIAGAPTMQP